MQSNIYQTLRNFSGTRAVGLYYASQICISKQFPRSMASIFPWRKNKDVSEEDKEALDLVTKRGQKKDDVNMTYNLKLLAVKNKLHNRKDYTPPADLNERVQKIINVECNEHKDADWQEIHFTDRRHKFQVLTRMEEEFSHDISNAMLSNINTVQEAVDYFSIPVKQTHALEEISKQSNLPENLHIHVEYNRWDPDNDKIHGGRTAFPGSNTIVTSIKYRRKYKDIITTKEKPGYYNHYENY